MGEPRHSAPRLPLLLLAALAACGMLTLAVIMTGDQGGQPLPADARPVLVRSLLFDDLPDGAVRVVDAAAEQEVGRLAPGSNSFVRGVLRSLVRERGRYQVGRRVPFELTQWSNGHLSLADPATGTHIELRAFGPTNEAAFAAIIQMEAS